MRVELNCIECVNGLRVRCRLVLVDKKVFALKVSDGLGLSSGVWLYGPIVLYRIGLEVSRDISIPALSVCPMKPVLNRVVTSRSSTK
jgi:hypothetical protein